MSYRRFFLGWDLRSAAGAWDDSTRRNTYLYRQDVEEVRSFDPVVWPSVLPRELGATAMQRFQWLWWDIEQLRAALNGLWIDRSDVHAAEFGLVVDALRPSDIDDLCARLGVEFDAAVGVPPHPRTLLLGFDVCDPWSLSGLANCGATDIQGDVRRHWSSLLNRWHLFDDLDAARSFCSYIDSEAPEHSPFFVYEVRACPLPPGRPSL